MAPVIPLTQRQDWKYSSEERKCRISHRRKFQVWVIHTLLSQYLRGHHEVLGKDSCTSLLIAETFPMVDRCKLEDFHHFKQREKAEFNDNALTVQTDLFIRGFFCICAHTYKSMLQVQGSSGLEAALTVLWDGRWVVGFLRCIAAASVPPFFQQF